MIIIRILFWVFLFGGGIDYFVWYLENGGVVVGMIIDKYCYFSFRKLLLFFEYKYRIVYFKIENVCDFLEI